MAEMAGIVPVPVGLLRLPNLQREHSAASTDSIRTRVE